MFIPILVAFQLLRMYLIQAHNHKCAQTWICKDVSCSMAYNGNSTKKMRNEFHLGRGDLAYPHTSPRLPLLPELLSHTLTSCSPPIQSSIAATPILNRKSDHVIPLLKAVLGLSVVLKTKSKLVPWLQSPCKKWSHLFSLVYVHPLLFGFHFTWKCDLR